MYLLLDKRIPKKKIFKHFFFFFFFFFSLSVAVFLPLVIVGTNGRGTATFLLSKHLLCAVMDFLFYFYFISYPTRRGELELLVKKSIVLFAKKRFMNDKSTTHCCVLCPYYIVILKSSSILVLSGLLENTVPEADCIDFNLHCVNQLID